MMILVMCLALVVITFNDDVVAGGIDDDIDDLGDDHVVGDIDVCDGHAVDDDDAVDGGGGDLGGDRVDGGGGVCDFGGGIADDDVGDVNEVCNQRVFDDDDNDDRG